MSEAASVLHGAFQTSRCNGLKRLGRATFRTAECLECGSAFETNQPAREFCNSRCKQRWHDRVTTRAIELYHLQMSQRYERTEAQAAGVWSIIGGLTAKWHAEDRDLRAGRRSHRTLKATLDANPHYSAITLRARKRRERIA